MLSGWIYVVLLFLKLNTISYIKSVQSASPFLLKDFFLLLVLIKTVNSSVKRLI